MTPQTNTFRVKYRWETQEEYATVAIGELCDDQGTSLIYKDRNDSYNPYKDETPKDAPSEDKTWKGYMGILRLTGDENNTIVKDYRSELLNNWEDLPIGAGNYSVQPILGDTQEFQGLTWQSPGHGAEMTMTIQEPSTVKINTDKRIPEGILVADLNSLKHPGVILDKRKEGEINIRPNKEYPPVSTNPDQYKNDSTEYPEVTTDITHRLQNFGLLNPYSTHNTYSAVYL